jgi:uncharacterized Zn finger protein
MNHKVINVYCPSCKCIVTAAPVIDKSGNVTYYCTGCGQELEED